MRTTSIPIIEAEVEAFQRDGAVCLRQVFNPDWVETVRAGVERNMAEPSDYAGWLREKPDDPGGFFDDYCNWRRIPEFQAFVYESPAAPMVAHLMRSDTGGLQPGDPMACETFPIVWPG